MKTLKKLPARPPERLARGPGRAVARKPAAVRWVEALREAAQKASWRRRRRLNCVIWLFAAWQTV